MRAVFRSGVAMSMKHFQRTLCELQRRQKELTANHKSKIDFPTKRGDIGVSPESLAHALTWLPPGSDLLNARTSSCLWANAAELCWEAIQVPARLAGCDDGNCSDVSSMAHGVGIVSRHCVYQFFARGLAARLFSLSVPPASAELAVPGRVSAPEPAVPTSDGCMALLVDSSRVASSVPELALAIYGTSAALGLLGSVPASGARHAQAVQKPLTVASVRTASAGAPGSTQACALAIQGLVVVFSWRLAAGHVEDGAAMEVRWAAGGREVIRAASFTGHGARANVAVLLEGHRDGPQVEVYACHITSGCVVYRLLATVLPTGLPRPLKSTPLLTAANTAPPGTLYGRMVLWASLASSAVIVALLPGDVSKSIGGRSEPCEAQDYSASSKDSLTSAAVVVFDQEKHFATRVLLRVGIDGAGLDLEATAWGYLVEGVDVDPGQPELCRGDCIVAIAGQSLHGLEEDALHWRFGRHFRDGAALSVLPAAHFQLVLAAESAGATMELAEPAAPVAQSSVEVCRIELGARLEAWAPVWGDRIALVADNRLLLANSSGVTRCVLSGVASSYGRPAVKVAPATGDLLAVGLARTVLVWRVPALVGKACEPELLLAVPLPARCGLSGAPVLGLGVHGGSVGGWLCAEVGSIGSGSGNGLDLWRFKSDPRPAQPSLLDEHRRGSDVYCRLEEAWGVAGAALEEMAAAVQSAMKHDAGAREESMQAWITESRINGVPSWLSLCGLAEARVASLARVARQWLMQHAGVDAGAVERARAALLWAEECQRSAIGPLHAALQAASRRE